MVNLGLGVPEDTDTDMVTLNQRLLMACVAACDCHVKSSDIKWHDETCHYRLFTEALGEINLLRSALQDAANEICRLKISENGEANADLIRAAGSVAGSGYLNKPCRTAEIKALQEAVKAIKNVGHHWRLGTAFQHADNTIARIIDLVPEAKNWV